MTLVFLILFAAISLAAILIPFWRANHGALDAATLASTKQRAELVAAYERALTILRDLDEDYQTGKLNQAEYQQSRFRWSEHGVALLKAIEQHDAARPNKSRRAANKQDKAHKALDDALEQAIASYAQAISSGQD